MKPYYSTDLGTLYHGDCLEIMPQLDPVDLVLTSPPYDDLRKYGGYSFDFKKTGKHIFKVLKNGGVCVWIVGDETKNGCESGTSFRQALHFMHFGFNLHDTMFYKKNSAPFPTSNRYEQVIEYMFIFSKCKIKTVNLIKDKKNKWAGSKPFGMRSNRQKSGELKQREASTINQFGIRTNVWEYSTGANYSTKDKCAFEHPAIFPEALARDHIISWSNENDTIMDPMCGSGTTLKQCERLKRKWIGIEIEEKYCEIAAKRIEAERKQLKLF